MPDAADSGQAIELRASALEPGTESSADLILLVATALWALNYPVIKLGLTEISPLAFTVLRFGLGGLGMAAVLRWRERSLGVARADLPLLLAAAVLGITLTQLCFIFSLVDTGASDVALLNATGPLVTAFLATVVGLERLGRRHWFGAALGMMGIVFIIHGGANAAFGTAPLTGDALALGATLCSSASFLPIRPLMRRYSAWRILTLEMLIGTALLVPLALPSIANQDFGRVTIRGWATLGYGVALTGVLANLLTFTAIARIGPSRAAMFNYLQSLLGVLLAVWLLGERVTVLQLVGGLIVIGSLLKVPRRWVSQGHSTRRDRRSDVEKGSGNPRLD